MASLSAKMVASTVTNNNNSDRSISRRKKKKKNLNSVRDRPDHAAPAAVSTPWKSDTQQQVYSSKLLQALRQVRSASPKRGRAVREAADRVLAVAAKGRTRWSRAILTNKVKLKFMKKAGSRMMRQNRAAEGTTTVITTTSSSGGGSRWQKKKPRVSVLRLKSKGLPAFQRKARVLGRLVPGCRKQPLPVILEEATDYIAALEMQVRAMSALADLLSGASSSNHPPAS
ncbi:OLC1v1020528C1 [Oldenlandia corymbosa var. corymbosa]|uniref:OLC1v1020528C1 n=1 Tax=Oldenlandia corymbosa var. corymbosa TaxID=529605 RepID=A0AAV1EGS6_OLDCO|nr:OLC1v1020528C1 [Oldenlandia corymbosa var. corymbosa]